MKLLVPLDGSNLSAQVMPWVKLLGDNVELLRTYIPVEELHLVQGLPMTISDLVNEQKPDDMIVDYLKTQAALLPNKQVTVECAVGHPADIIMDRARSFDAVVMASHGSSGLERWLLGSVTTKVVRGCTTPVLVVSARAHPSPPKPAKVETLFVPLDGSPTSEVALKEAKRLALRFGAKIVLYEGVVYRADTDDADDWQTLLAKEYLAEVAQKMSGFEVETVVLESSKGPDIVEQARRHGADLIVMGSHGRGGIARWVLGSVTESVVQRADCPVLVVYDRHH